MKNENSKIRAGIFGGSGYGGSELLRILLLHPDVEIAFVTANEHAGKAVGDVHRNLNGLTTLRFTTAPEDLTLLDIDVAFFALPHGQAMRLVPQLKDSVKVIDLSGDFRIEDMDEFQRSYGFKHDTMELQSSFVYGLTETNRDAIKQATHIANPGCFATATLLALSPLVANGVIAGRVVVDAKTGSSGSGAKPAANTHHPQRTNSFYAYKPFTHQHVPEILRDLNRVGSFGDSLVFMTHSLPVSRGVFASCYFETDDEMAKSDLEEIYREYYRDAFFVRIVDGSPDINWVKNTNFCDIAVFSSGRNVVVFSAIDNLVKGAAGQAVQNMDLMFGLDETAGLIFTGGNP